MKLLLVTLCCLALQAQPRAPKSKADLRSWLENMVWHHNYSLEEISAATGLHATALRDTLARFQITRENRPKRNPDDALLVLPYPGGRHPRIGFLDGAIDPQRETKLSIFTPWDDSAYVVADIPEALWSNLGLTYLAHTHIPTIWTNALSQLEWEQQSDGSYRMERTLPNGIRFGTQAHPEREAVFIRMWLSNGTSRALSDLRVQNCVMLKGAPGFDEQTNSNKVLRGSFAACRDATGTRWIISGFAPIGRVWANPPVPCLHADPKFPDTPPGETAHIAGLITFYSGTNITAELDRLEPNLRAGPPRSPDPRARLKIEQKE